MKITGASDFAVALVDRTLADIGVRAALGGHGEPWPRESWTIVTNARYNGAGNELTKKQMSKVFK